MHHLVAMAQQAKSGLHVKHGAVNIYLIHWSAIDWPSLSATPEADVRIACWRDQMQTFSALLTICTENSPVPGDFPAQRPVTRSFDVFVDLRLNKRFRKQSWGWWFETLLRPFWRHCNAVILVSHQSANGAAALHVDPQVALRALDGVCTGICLEGAKANTVDQELLFHVDTEPFTFHTGLSCFELGYTPAGMDIPQRAITCTKDVPRTRLQDVRNVYSKDVHKT